MNKPLTIRNIEKGKTICSTNTVGGVHVHWGRVWLPLSGTGSDALGARPCCSMSCNISRMGDRDIGYSHKQQGKTMMIRLVIATQALRLLGWIKCNVRQRMFPHLQAFVWKALNVICLDTGSPSLWPQLIKWHKSSNQSPADPEAVI